jgi:hypothetical protein
MNGKLCGLSALLVGSLACSGSWAQSGIVEERATEIDGVYTSCGTGEGLPECRDYNGETYKQEIKGQTVESETSGELARDAQRIRNESPEELERTISDLEDQVHP